MHCLKKSSVWSVLLYLLQFLWMITYSLTHLRVAVTMKRTSVQLCAVKMTVL